MRPLINSAIVGMEECPLDILSLVRIHDGSLPTRAGKFDWQKGRGTKPSVHFGVAVGEGKSAVSFSMIRGWHIAPVTIAAGGDTAWRKGKCTIVR